MDRDWGAKAGSGGVASAQQTRADAQKRVRDLALAANNLADDPYFMKNHLGTFECKLCLTIHKNEPSYIMHAQGKKHLANLARRAAKEGAATNPTLLAQGAGARAVKPRKTIKIGRPGYRITRQEDPETAQRSLLFEVDYPEIDANLQPRHRFMSAYEQKVEPPDGDYQFLLMAAEPYETIGFKIPNDRIDRDPGKFRTAWDAEKKVFTLQLCFEAAKPSSDAAVAQPPLTEAVQ